MKDRINVTHKYWLCSTCDVIAFMHCKWQMTSPAISVVQINLLPVLACVLYTCRQKGCLQKLVSSLDTHFQLQQTQCFSHVKNVKGLPYFAIYDMLLKSTAVFITLFFAPSIFVFINQNFTAEVLWPSTACNQSTGHNSRGMLIYTVKRLFYITDCSSNMHSLVNSCQCTVCYLECYIYSVYTVP